MWSRAVRWRREGVLDDRDIWDPWNPIRLSLVCDVHSSEKDFHDKIQRTNSQCRVRQLEQRADDEAVLCTREQIQRENAKERWQEENTTGKPCRGVHDLRKHERKHHADG